MILRPLLLALALILLPAAVEPQDIVRGNQALELCQSFQGFDARLSTLEDAGWDRLDPAAPPPRELVDAFAVLAVVSHVSPKATIAARWLSVLELGRTTTKARFAKKDTYFHRSALYQAPGEAQVFLHLVETRPSPDSRALSCQAVGLSGDSLTVVSGFRKRNILGTFAEMRLSPRRGEDRRSTAMLVLFDQPEIADLLPGIDVPAYGISATSTLPTTR